MTSIIRTSQLFFALFILFAVAARGSDLPLLDGDRIVIEGDSGADAKKWSCYLASYLLLLNPALTLHIQVLARGGTTVEQALTDLTGYHGYDEYAKLVASLSPDYVFINYGVNGPDSTEQFTASMSDLTANYVVTGSGAVPIMIGPQPIAEADGKARDGDYEDAETTLASARGWPMAAVWHDLFSVWTNPANYLLLSETLDSHPDTSGHILMAYSIIKTLGFSSLVSSATIDASKLDVTAFSHCTIGKLKSDTYGGVDFTRLDGRLPWAIDATQDGYAKAVEMLPSVADWQDYSMTVTGLSYGNYDIYCDGVQIGSEIPNTQLAAGWNMADVQVGPVYNQVQEVLGLIRDMLGVDRVTLGNVGPPWQGVYRYKSNAVAYYGAGQRGDTLLTALQPAISEIASYDALIHAAVQPVRRTYIVRASGSPPPGRRAPHQQQRPLPR